ncbi:MAG: ABC transporter permease subunit [Acidisphaera sp.]|nr:ABC transporter permease subunit [Acidisphaera sp.]
MSASSPSSALAGAGRVRRDRFPGRPDFWGLLLLAPALLLLFGLFGVPAVYSVIGALAGKQGAPSLEHVRMAIGVYGKDILFTAWLVCLSVAVTAALAVLIAGYLTLGSNRLAVRILGWLYRWPLFVPMICAAQMMRSFLAKNGLLNNGLVATGLLTPAGSISLLDWRGVLITFVWKQLPFVTLLLAGAMASLDRSMIEAARDLGAGRLRVLVGIVLPLVRGPLLVGCVLTFVTLMSVLSVPMMLTADTPTMITVDMAYRINTFADYGTADALGLISYVMTMLVGWIYLRDAARQRGLSR